MAHELIRDEEQLGGRVPTFHKKTDPTILHKHWELAQHLRFQAQPEDAMEVSLDVLNNCHGAEGAGWFDVRFYRLEGDVSGENRGRSFEGKGSWSAGVVGDAFAVSLTSFCFPDCQGKRAYG